jgi:hypothetical protein
MLSACIIHVPDRQGLGHCSWKTCLQYVLTACRAQWARAGGW